MSAYRRKRPKEVLLDEMARAETFEEWDEAAFRLDELLGNDLWYAFPHPFLFLFGGNGG